MTTLATLPETSSTTPAGSAHAVDGDPFDGFSHAVLDSIVNRRGETFSLAVDSERDAASVSSRLELLLLTARMASGGVSVRVAPTFLEDTYPAMRLLAGALDDAGMSGLWTPAGSRSIRVMEAWQVFISVDTPSRDGGRGGPDRPDTLLEVAGADRISGAWYCSRVAPRASARGLTTVFYGPRARAGEGSETLFERVRRSNLTRQWRDGVRRHFDAAPLERSEEYAA